MLLMRAAPMGYAKMDKVDADEARHLKAQFLIHKALEKNGPTRRPPAAFARGGGCRVVKATRIGVRLKRLRIAVRSFRLGVCRSVLKHIRNLRRLGVRVGNELGAGNPRSAAFSAWGRVVTAMSALIAALAAVADFLLRHKLSYLFTGGEAVADLCPMLVATIVLCGIQPVLSGVAVGCGWQALVAYINIGCYYFIGVPLGVLLGFEFDYGIKVEEAGRRVGKWNGLKAASSRQRAVMMPGED